MKRMKGDWENLVCTLCHPHRGFKSVLNYGNHMRHFHKLTAETYKSGRAKGYNTGYWVRR